MYIKLTVPHGADLLALLEIGRDKSYALSMFIDQAAARNLAFLCSEWVAGGTPTLLSDLEAATKALINAVECVNGVVSSSEDYKRCALATERARAALAAVRL